MKRTTTEKYHVITYDRDCGYDDKLDYSTLEQARTACKQYIADNYDAAVIINTERKKVTAIYGNKFRFEYLTALTA